LTLDLLDEARVNIQRLSVMACELGSLAQAPTRRSRVAVGEAFAYGNPGNAAPRPEPVFRCDPQTAVAVDLHQLRRAIESLSRVAGPVALQVSDFDLTDAACAACGKVVRVGKFVRVQALGMRPAVLRALGAPFSQTHKLQAEERLSIAALDHTTHLNGGHLIAGTDQSLSVALPRA
jgi:hypothetical protein